MPTPPPWWIDTQVAPLATLTIALSSGQSAIASEPSAIASVSRYGEATEPQSRWSRPMTIGALTSPRGDQVVERQPGLVALAVAEPADAGRQALEVHPLLGHAGSTACSGSLSREQVEHGLGRCAAMSFGSPDSAAQRNGPLPSQNSGRM